jgi:hypothetical protein
LILSNFLKKHVQRLFVGATKFPLKIIKKIIKKTVLTDLHVICVPISEKLDDIF